MNREVEARQLKVVRLCQKNTTFSEENGSKSLLRLCTAKNRNSRNISSVVKRIFFGWPLVNRDPPPSVDVAIIQRDWTLTEHGQYIFGTASLHRRLAQQGLQCKDNPGQGNCLWYSLLDAGLHSESYPTYQRLKRDVYDFAQRNSSHIENYLAEFLQIPTSRRSRLRAAWLAGLLTNLRTPGRDADFDQLSVAAIAVGRHVHVHDVENHRVEEICGTRPWDPLHVVPDQPLHIAYRRHQTIWAYHRQFNPLALSSGHYWAIVEIAQTAPAPSSRRARRPPQFLHDYIRDNPS